MADEEPIDFACPRCGDATLARFYGPCSACRSALIASFTSEGRVVESGRFEPALHVVPNQVATKE